MATRGKTTARREPRGFWHQPRQMETVAGMLLFVATVTLGYALTALLLTLPVAPLRQLVITRPLQHVTPAQVEYVALDSVAGNFFTVNLDRVQTAFEKLPWVRKASVRRRWPDTLEVTLQEQTAVARWKPSETGDTLLINPDGELFAAAGQAELPLLGGPPGRAPDVLARYREFAAIVTPQGLTPVALSLSSREAWTLRLTGADQPVFTVELGRDQARAPLLQRLSRFVNSYKEARTRLSAQLSQVDLRYPNGFTVHLSSRDAEE